MEDRHKTQLRRERLFLTEHLQPILDGLIDRLVLTDTLTDNMKQEIEAEPTPVSRVRKLLDILPRRGPHAFNNLCQALLKMKEYEILKHLDPVLASASGGGTISNVQPTDDKEPSSLQPSSSIQKPSKPPSTGVSVAVPQSIPVPTSISNKQPSVDPIKPPGKEKPQVSRQFSREIEKTEQPSEEVDKDLNNWPENLNLSPGSIRNVAVQDCTHADLKKILSDIQNYDLQSPIKGRAVIVKNVIYDDETNMQKRGNAEWDAYRLHDVLKKLRFDVKMYVNQTYEKLIEKLKREKEEDQHDAFILVILSYGGNGTVICTDGKEIPLSDIIQMFTDDPCWHKLIEKLKREKEEDQHDAFILVILSYGGNGTVICTDGKEIPLSDIIQMFSDDRCPSLKGKPKLFFIQACGIRLKAEGQGLSEPDEKKEKKRDSGVGDATDAMKSLSLGPSSAGGDIIDNSQDMLIAFATQPDVEVESKQYLSLFILALWTVLYKFSRNHHILELLNKMNEFKRDTSGRPVKLCEIRHSLTKKFYFLPGYVSENHSSIDPLPSLPPPAV